MELIEIGGRVMDPSYCSSGFLSKNEKNHFINLEAREIGGKLYKLSGDHVKLMIEAHNIVKLVLGSIPARELQACWANDSRIDDKIELRGIGQYV